MLAKLLKFAPTLVVIVVCGALLLPYLDRSSAANPASKAATEAATSARPPKRAKLGQPARDPFHLTTPAPPAGTQELSASKVTTPPDAREQELARLQELVGGLSLGGTYLDRRSRLAIIGGKIYAENDPILDEEGEATGLVVRSVSADRVRLVGLGTEFPLTYPDRIIPASSDEDSEAQPEAASALSSILGNGNGQGMEMLPLLMNGEGGGISGILASLLYNQLQNGQGSRAVIRPEATRMRGARSTPVSAGGPAGGDPALYGGSDAKPGKGKKSKPVAGPAGGDPALYAEQSGGKSGGKKSPGTGAKKSAPAGGDPALYGGDTKKKGGRSKR